MDPLLEWVQYPEKRDPALHLMLVEVVSVTNEQYIFTNAPSSKVSDDGGKTWYNTLQRRTGRATLKIIECPIGEAPPKFVADFARHRYVRTKEVKWTDTLVVPGNRVLAFVRKERGGEWTLKDGNLHDPLGIADPVYGVQGLFKTPLATKEALAEWRKQIDDSVSKAKRQEGSK